MTLHKAIMKLSELENKYLRNSIVENRNKYKKQKNFCSKLYKKERKGFYSNLDIKNIIYNKLFWKTMKPFLSDKCNHSSKISLVRNGNVISDDFELAKAFKNFFDNSTIYKRRHRYFDYNLQKNFQTNILESDTTDTFDSYFNVWIMLRQLTDRNFKMIPSLLAVREICLLEF